MVYTNSVVKKITVCSKRYADQSGYGPIFFPQILLKQPTTKIAIIINPCQVIGIHGRKHQQKKILKEDGEKKKANKRMI